MEMENIRMTVVFVRSKAQEVLPFLSLHPKKGDFHSAIGS